MVVAVVVVGAAVLLAEEAICKQDKFRKSSCYKKKPRQIAVRVIGTDNSGDTKQDVGNQQDEDYDE